jgi:hypothetical protein
MGRKKVQSSFSEVAFLEIMNIKHGFTKVNIRLNMARGIQAYGAKDF